MLSGASYPCSDMHVKDEQHFDLHRGANVVSLHLSGAAESSNLGDHTAADVTSALRK
jgi:hypothetical protein